MINELARTKDAINSLEAKLALLHNETKNQNDRDFKSMTRLTKATVFVACCAALFGGIQAFLARGALQETRSEQRAWLKVSLEPGDIFWADADISDDGIAYRLMMTPKLIVSNVGHLPAFSVTAFLLGYAVTDTDTHVAGDSSCANLFKHNVLFDTDKIIFPNDPVQVNQIGGTTETVKVTKVEGRLGADLDTFRSSGRPFHIFLHGCISYSLLPSGPPHYTEFHYVVHKGVVSELPSEPIEVGSKVVSSQVSLLNVSFLDKID